MDERATNTHILCLHVISSLSVGIDFSRVIGLDERLILPSVGWRGTLDLPVTYSFIFVCICTCVNSPKNITIPIENKSNNKHRRQQKISRPLFFCCSSEIFFCFRTKNVLEQKRKIQWIKM